MKKTIIITGSSSGVGLHAAKHLSLRGHQVFGLSRSQPDSNEFTTIITDITDKKQVDAAITEVMKHTNTIDVLINNAGMGMVGAVEDASADEIGRLFSLNLVGTVHMISTVLPHMRSKKKGTIINISSIGSEMGLPFRGFYSASKAAVDKMTEALRYEIAPWNIMATVVHLGDINTEIAKSRVRSNVSSVYRSIFDQVYEGMNQHVANGTDPEEVARYLEQIILKPTLKGHYYFGKIGQRLAVPLKHLLPQSLFESLMKKYSKT